MSLSICFSLPFADEREKNDPTGFRDAVIAGLEAAEDLEQISKYLDSAGNKLDYRRYGEVLFDILIAGGLLGMYLIFYVRNSCKIYQKCTSLPTDRLTFNRLPTLMLQFPEGLLHKMARNHGPIAVYSRHRKTWNRCGTMSR